MEKINDIICIQGFGADSNCYLIDNILVDTGTGLNNDYLYKQIKELEMKPDDIDLIVNTHCHYDHVGGNYLFENAKIAIHENDAAPLENANNPLTASFLFEKSIKRHDVDKKLKEGDEIANFEVLHTPGHTSGGICLWDGKTLISGDTVFANGGFGRLDIGGDSQSMANSLEMLKKLDVNYLLPGHGPWVDNGKKHIELANQMFFSI
ncbi:N-acyl homoserine lactonase [Methanobrevibacter cuticularis]|uniref:N-acyl homoserine lactonase n=1 Tax=Methanobrevibacter cuticularis TaxID=47311 RepID=A0A166CTP3_9EURY|nr:MBL fold metallo-hydrolase [Methanobrevibacter cuticularis]KZX16737.1 N-acyl homoserine lactonase [Methanobrevibacter cuticularis]